MALAIDTPRGTEPRSVEAYARTVAVTYFAGALVGLDRATGRCVLWSDTAGLEFLGLVEQRFPLTAFGVLTTSPDEVQVNTSGPIVENVSVAGAAAITDQGAMVYATDDGTFTLTPTVNVNAIGKVKRWRTATFCDVRLFTPAEYVLQ